MGAYCHHKDFTGWVLHWENFIHHETTLVESSDDVVNETNKQTFYDICKQGDDQIKIHCIIWDRKSKS